MRDAEVAFFYLMMYELWIHPKMQNLQFLALKTLPAKDIQGSTWEWAAWLLQTWQKRPTCWPMRLQTSYRLTKVILSYINRTPPGTSTTMGVYSLLVREGVPANMNIGGPSSINLSKNISNRANNRFVVIDQVEMTWSWLQNDCKRPTKPLVVTRTATIQDNE